MVRDTLHSMESLLQCTSVLSQEHSETMKMKLKDSCKVRRNNLNKLLLVF